ncbi:putative pentatricopeptide repeat-containing protein At3g23330 [Lycium ferocissimum]|uniref:putative pentatricopeptide repeat-containing protein At3g23330 n=1 Tax=Lycium ferocissimum TaxID=112874 RepID=UPI002816349E|nr:putative pentatricopeptide repeat-containing protein At3g23330 [Lycium ferocissimum]
MFTKSQFKTGPNFHSITNIFHHFCNSKNLKAIKIFHAHLITTGLLFISPNLQFKLISSSTTSLQTLTNFFKLLKPRNPLLLNSILSHFSQNGYHSLSLHTFSFMHFSVIDIDSYTLCSSITASSAMKNVNFGKMIHTHVIKSGWLSSVYVGCGLIDLYAKSLCIKNAGMLFDEMPVKNTVCVNAFLSGYSEAKMWMDGLALVRKMLSLNLCCDNFTFSAALRACVGLSAFELGKQVHGCVIRKVDDVESDVFLQSLLIEMYGKCGLVEKARRVFDMVGFRCRESKKDVVLWTSMLGVCGRNGKFEEAIGLFNDMVMEGIKPDGVALLTVLSACSHTGHVNLGMQYFESMACNYTLEPRPEHYSCVIDLLCRAGELDRAWNLINDLSYKENGNFTVTLWGALLSACHNFDNVELGKLAAQRALDLDPQNDGVYVLLSNMYARNGMWDEIEMLREQIKEKGLKKDIGHTLIDITR